MNTVVTLCESWWMWHLVWMLSAAGHAREVTDRNATGVVLSYCESETFVAKCYDDQVVIMEHAMYGRMKKGRCVESSLGYLGCKADVLHLTDRKCSGKSECRIRIPDGHLDTSKPCFKELKVYMEASYSCMRVGDTNDLCQSSGSYRVSSVPAYISGQKLYKDPKCMPKSGHHNKDHPHFLEWTLRSQPGQTINISLIDFGWDPNTTRINAVSYGYLYDKASKRNVSLISDNQREKQVLHSNGSSVQLVLNVSQSSNFLLKLQALGCADLRPPKDAWLKRPHANEAIIGCNDTRQTWHLKCQGRSWVGVIGNCTQHVTIVIIVGISLLICTLIVITGLMCIKRVSKKPCCQGSNQQVKYDNVKTEEQIYKEGDAAYLSPKYSGKNQCPLPRKTKNDYFHIWEHPLPDPGSSSVEQHGPQQLKVKLPPKETRNNNSTDTGSVAGYHVSMTSKSSDADSKYFILDRDINFDKEEPYP